MWAGLRLLTCSRLPLRAGLSVSQVRPRRTARGHVLFARSDAETRFPSVTPTIIRSGSRATHLDSGPVTALRHCAASGLRARGPYPGPRSNLLTTPVSFRCSHAGLDSRPHPCTLSGAGAGSVRYPVTRWRYATEGSPICLDHVGAIRRGLRPGSVSLYAFGYRGIDHDLGEGARGIRLMLLSYTCVQVYDSSIPVTGMLRVTRLCAGALPWRGPRPVPCSL